MVVALIVGIGTVAGLCHTRELITRKPRLCSANPKLKMMWCVPVTHKVPLGLRTRRAAFGHLTLNWWSFSNPIGRIESLCPLRFRVLLGDGAHELEVMR
jgi:hypothetical protein